MACTINNKLAECLAAKGINQSQLARRFDLSRAHVSRLVRGSVLPSISLALRFAKYFDKPLESIFALVESDQQDIFRPPSVASGNSHKQNRDHERRKICN